MLKRTRFEDEEEPSPKHKKSTGKANASEARKQAGRKAADAAVGRAVEEAASPSPTAQQGPAVDNSLQRGLGNALAAARVIRDSDAATATRADGRGFGEGGLGGALDPRRVARDAHASAESEERVRSKVATGFSAGPPVTLKDIQGGGTAPNLTSQAAFPGTGQSLVDKPAVPTAAQQKEAEDSSESVSFEEVHNPGGGVLHESCSRAAAATAVPLHEPKLIVLDQGGAEVRSATTLSNLVRLAREDELGSEQVLPSGYSFHEDVRSWVARDGNANQRLVPGNKKLNSALQLHVRVCSGAVQVDCPLLLCCSSSVVKHNKADTASKCAEAATRTRDSTHHPWDSHHLVAPPPPPHTHSTHINSAQY
jgi:hypothetical protein